MRPKAYPLLLGTRNRPAIDWNFAGSGSLPAALTFSRASLATMYDASGTLVWCPHNLLTYSEQIDNAAWAKIGLGAGSTPVVTANAGVAPDGTTTAERVQLNCGGSTISDRSICNQSVSGLMAGRQYTGAIYIKAYSAGEVGKQLRLFGDSLVTEAIVTLTADWQLVQTSGTAAAASGNFGLETRGTVTANTTADFLVWGARLSIGPLQPYYPTTSAAYYGPRLTYDPVTHAALGLLVEEQRTNLLTYSEQLDNAAWTKTNATVTADATAGPDGLVTADKLVDSAATGLHALSVIATITAGASYTLSMFLKPAEYSRGRLYFGSGANGFQVDFDLSGGGSVSGGTALGTGTYTSATITAVANGFYRVAVSGIVDASSTSGTLYCYMHNGASVSYTGVVGNGMYFGGRQLEAGAFATSYIPTGAASATRAADVVTCTGSAFSSWFNGTEGTFVFEAVLNAATTSNVNLAQGSARPWAYKNSGDSYLYSFDGATALSYGTVTIGAAIRAGISFDATGRSAVINGGTVSTGAHNGQLLSSTSIALGSAGCWTIKRVRYWRKRLTNAQLQALTA